MNELDYMTIIKNLENNLTDLKDYTHAYDTVSESRIKDLRKAHSRIIQLEQCIEKVKDNNQLNSLDELYVHNTLKNRLDIYTVEEMK